MKRLAFFLSCMIATHCFAQKSLQKLWETDSVLAIPESVLYDAKNKVLYTSLIDGAPWEADGKGGIAKLNLSGKITNAAWITGLQAPKGMAIVGNNLYVADMNKIVVIDIKKGIITKQIVIDSAVNLNDVTADKKGIVYTSDSKLGKVFRLEKGKSAEYLSGYNGINGLRAVGNDLYVAAGRSLFKVDAAKNKQTIGAIDQGGDGVEPVGNGDWIASAWAGYVYYIYANGKRDLLLDLHTEKNAADIGYDPVKRIVYIPTFRGKSIAAYQLK
jgi:hypothetical protein